jgi:hypothetical protein
LLFANHLHASGSGSTFHSADSAIITKKYLVGVERKYRKLDRRLTRSSQITLKRLQRSQEYVRKKMLKVDSLGAQRLLSYDEKVRALQMKLEHPVPSQVQSLAGYIPGLDSMQTSLAFLQGNPNAATLFQPKELEELKKTSSALQLLQGKMQSATEIKELIRQRKQQLKDELDKLGLTKEFKKLSREAYYYQQQLNEYKAMLSDPDRMAKKILSAVRSTPAFKEFFSRNSILARLFPMPEGYGTAQALQGLQTRTTVQQQLTRQLSVGSGSGISSDQYLQQQVQQAQAQLNVLKDKVNKLGGGSSDLDIPDFKPNSQRTKTFWKRLEYGINIQSQRPNGLLPVTSDIALAIGYRLNDKSTIGIGAGYKLGWGRDLANISLSSQGISLRSYVDIRLRGSIWISGGYEHNYQHEFRSIEVLKDLDAWQRSGLAGVTKKYRMGSKNGNLQLLWDFLSYSQVPRTQPLKFRVGYTF